MKNILKKTSERGQAIILIAFSIIGMVAIVGLMTDGGIMLIEYARLKRGIDSASIAAAAQFRKNFNAEDIQRAGDEFLRFNQSDSEVTIYICDADGSLGTVANKGDDPTGVPLGAWNDPDLCPATGEPARKLVRVEASRYVNFGFLRVINQPGAYIKASSIGEAASIDMVLVIDTSTSMAYETNDFDMDGDGTVDIGVLNSAYPDPKNPVVGNPGDNPEACNSLMASGLGSGRCEPLGKVIDAALAFVNEMFFPYDRVAVVATTGQAVQGSSIGNRQPVTVLDFNDDVADVGAALRSLKVYQPNRCATYPFVYDPNNLTPCLNFQGDDGQTYYRQQVCIARNFGHSPVTCGPSNIGGGLYEAGNQYANARQDSFWVSIALFGGPTNASNPPGTSHPNGFCPGTSSDPLVDPDTTWSLTGGSGFCRDEDSMPASYSPPTSSWSPAAETYTAQYMENFNWTGFPGNWPAPTRHNYTVVGGVIDYPDDYDADDYARDGADFVAAPSPQGQGATLFSICMGSYCRTYPNIHDPASGELLGRYIALQAGDSPGITANHGLYFYAENSDVVDDVFSAIAENIFTRISQ